MINRFFYSIVSLLLLLSLLSAGSVTVSYLSQEYVYLNGGKADGLTVGTIVTVRRDQITIAHLEVVYIAEHSASCKILDKTGEIKSGDMVSFLETKVPDDSSTTPKQIIPSSLAMSYKTEAEDKSRKKSDISGYLALQWYHFQDQSENNYHLDQPALRFKFKARNLWDRPIRLEIKTRSRYYERHGQSGTRVSPTEWRHQLYTAALIYENPESGIGLSLGRIFSSFMSGAGYIDGFQLDYLINPAWKAGVFAGYQPEWKTYSFQRNRHKYGAFMTYHTTTSSAWQAQASLSAVGEYHDTVVSREFLYLQSSVNMPGAWHVYQSMEIDINRAWRQQRTGKTIALSSLYLSGSKQITPFFSTQLTYDNRQNYYTYDYYSLADSLFDDAFRQGLRLFLNLKLHSHYRFSFNSGVRKREDQGQTTYTNGVSASVMRLFIDRLSLTGQGALFTNLYSKGIAYNLNLSKRFWMGHEIAVAFGSQQYRLLLNQERNHNNWLRLQGSIALAYRMNLYTYYEYDFGDDIKGQNIFAELGFYF